MADKQRKNKSKKKRGPGKPWKPGQSGNPLGRPKKGEALTDILVKIGETYEKKTRKGKLLYNQALGTIVWDKALRGTRWACELIYNRIDGKAVEKHDVNLEAGEKLLEVIKNIQAPWYSEKK